MKTHIAALLVGAALALIGCTGGGPSGGTTPALPPAGSPSLQVLPATYDFGRVTSNNVPAPLEVTIANTGNASLRVTSIELGVSPAFAIQVGGGTRPCGSTSPTVAAGESCTIHVAFQPAATGTYTSNVQIRSNDAATPTFGLPVSGSAEPVSALTVRINQLDTSCPASNAATAYVSVTDQGGYSVLGLGLSHFSVTLGAPPTSIVPNGLDYVETVYRPIALAAALDHSGSLTSQPVAFADMKKGFAEFFDRLRPTDVGAVVNFDSEVEVVQAFTSDRALLAAAVSAPWDKGTNTRLYDAVVRAVDETAPQANYRRVVIVATDGIDQAPSNATLAQAIAHAKARNVAVFTVGIGGSVNAAVLQQMAEETGGLYYQANTSQNLATIYRQVSTVLFEKQYVLRFDQPERGLGTVSPLTIGVVGPTSLTGSAGTTITSCR